MTEEFMPKFKIGDVVQFKMGASPLMVVTTNSKFDIGWLPACETVRVFWFDAKGHLISGQFPIDILDKVNGQNLDVSQSPPEKKEFQRMSDGSKPDVCPVCSVTNGISKRRCANVTCPYTKLHNAAI